MQEQKLQVVSTTACSFDPEGRMQGPKIKMVKARWMDWAGSSLRVFLH
jgi:hypothetical protein